MTQTLDRIRASLVGLRMPCALEALEHTMRQLERGEIGALEAIDALLVRIPRHPASYSTSIRPAVP